VEILKLKKIEYSDFLGIFASGLCAVHCAITPIFFLSKPLLEHSNELHSHGNLFWSALDYVFLILSFIAIWYSSKHTSHKNIKTIFWVAWCIFTLGLISEKIDFEYGLWLTYLGSIILVIAHIINYRHCRKCKVNPKNSY